MTKMGLNTAEVLQNVEAMIKESEDYKANTGYAKKYRIRDICVKLSIFDWWNEELSVSQLKQMRAFLKTAVKLGYNGYACFKVGASGCANGMWAHKKESADGYSPDGESLYHSFVHEYSYWDCEFPNGKWISDFTPDKKYMFSLKEVKTALKEYASGGYPAVMTMCAKDAQARRDDEMK